MDTVTFLNRLIRDRGYYSCLDIGFDLAETATVLSIPHRVRVNAAGDAVLAPTPDEFFRQNQRRFDVILLGASRNADVLRVVENALRHLSPGGLIVLSSCLPRADPKLRAAENWSRMPVTVLRERRDCDVAVLDVDGGLGIVLPRANTKPLAVPDRLLSTGSLEERNRVFRVVSEEEMASFLRDPSSVRDGERPTFRHFILTRFSLNNANEDWNRTRLALFEKVYLRSLQSQTCRQFECVLFVDLHFPDCCRGQLESLLPDFRYRLVTITAPGRFGVTAEAVGQALCRLPDTVTHVITTRLDTDDAVARDFVARLHDVFAGQDCLVVNFRRGYYFQQGRVLPAERVSNMFLSVISSRRSFVHCYVHSHPNMARTFPTLDLEGTPAWVHTRHPAACSASAHPLIPESEGFLPTSLEEHFDADFRVIPNG